MKKLYSQAIVLCLLIFTSASLSGQMGSPERPEAAVYSGEWKFEAPDAPEGSTEGRIMINGDEVMMTFDDHVAFPSTWVRYRNDSIIYQMQFDLATVVFSLKIVDKDNISGKAVWEEGETPVYLRKKIVGVLI